MDAFGAPAESVGSGNTPVYQDLNRFAHAPGFRGRSGLFVLLWQLVGASLFRLSPQPFYGWRRWLLRRFGAVVGPGVLVRPTARITYPWKVQLGSHCWIGDYAELYSLGPIFVGANAVISQRSYLCAGTHDYNDVTFPLVSKAIVIDDEAWVATDCFIAPGVKVGRGAIVGARSTVFADIPPNVIVAGTPATVLRTRPLPTRGLESTDKSVRKLIVAIGQLPPPLSGLSHITSCVLDKLRTHNTVHVYNVAARTDAMGLKKHATRIFAIVRAGLGLLRFRHATNRQVYIACEGGLGLLYTLALVSTARFLAYPILLHHHSYAYIDKPNNLMRALLKNGGALTHIFLCDTMRERFEATYNCSTAAKVVSNAAFVPPGLHSQGSRVDDFLVLGHLSNLTREKGLHTFLELLSAAVSRGLQVRGVLAGSAASKEDQKLIADAVRRLEGRLDYRGPVYGEDKLRFYREIDIFIFPTEYRNEAQPTVLFEAQAAGCSVIAFSRGCIAGQLGHSDIVVDCSSSFLKPALAEISMRVRQRLDRAVIAAAYAEKHREATLSAGWLFSYPPFPASL